MNEPVGVHQTGRPVAAGAAVPRTAHDHPIVTPFERWPFLRRLVLLVVVFFCFKAATRENNARPQYAELQTWPSTEAVVVSADVDCVRYSYATLGCGRYCPQLGYNYSVGGESYTATNQVFDFKCVNLADFVNQHQPGKTVRISYDPQNPGTSLIPEVVRDPGFPVYDVALGLLFLFIFVADLAISWHSEEQTAKTAN